MDAERIAEIRARVGAATEGPWEAEYSGEQGDCVLDILGIGVECRDCGRIDGGCDRDVETLAAQVERVRTLHRPRTEQVLAGDCAKEECDHEDECPTTPFVVCSECYRIGEEGDAYFAERSVSHVAWPCPTVRAHDGEAYPAAPQMDDRLRAVTAERDRLAATIGQARGLLSETINGRARWIDSVPEAIRLLGGEEA